MVYCTKCGAENEDGAQYCVKCGASLQMTRERTYRSDNECFGPRDGEDSCFGLRHGGAILGVIFGLLIIAAGVAAIMGKIIWNWLGPLFVIAIGIVIIAGALRRGWRR